MSYFLFGKYVKSFHCACTMTIKFLNVDQIKITAEFKITQFCAEQNANDKRVSVISSTETFDDRELEETGSPPCPGMIDMLTVTGQLLQKH